MQDVGCCVGCHWLTGALRRAVGPVRMYTQRHLENVDTECHGLKLHQTDNNRSQFDRGAVLIEPRDLCDFRPLRFSQPNAVIYIRLVPSLAKPRNPLPLAGPPRASARGCSAAAGAA